MTLTNLISKKQVPLATRFKGTYIQSVLEQIVLEQNVLEQLALEQIVLEQLALEQIVLAQMLLEQIQLETNTKASSLCK
jgi:hypothetical protein